MSGIASESLNPGIEMPKLGMPGKLGRDRLGIGSGIRGIASESLNPGMPMLNDGMPGSDGSERDGIGSGISGSAKLQPIGDGQ